MNPSFRRPTVADVARAAGVSTATVSRVLEDSPKVAARTRDRVQDAMRAIGYYGNSQASQLVSGRAQTVGIITSNTVAYGYARTISGIENEARQVGMAALITVIESSSDRDVAAAVAAVASHVLSGVVVVDFDAAAHATIPLIPSYLPVVSATSPSYGPDTGRPYVAYDDHLGAKESVEHLIALGHTGIFVMAQPNNDPPERRSVGAVDALTDALLPHYPIVRCESWEPSSGYDACAQILDTYGDRVTAIVCPNDELALGAIRAIHDRGLRVPEDISITGFDDIPVAQYLSPSMTTVHQSFMELGRRSFRLLMDVVTAAEQGDAGQPDPQIDLAQSLDPFLVVRESTAAPNPRRGPLAS